VLRKAIKLVEFQLSFTVHQETRMWADVRRDGRPAEYRCALCSTPQSLADAHY